MPILVKIPDGSEPASLAIIELQGELESMHGDSNNRFIGELHYTKEGVPILIIDSYILHGKETTLAKPFVVLERKRSDELKDSRPLTSQENVPPRKAVVETQTEYLVRAVVRKKLIFRSRPKPIKVPAPGESGEDLQPE